MQPATPDERNHTWVLISDSDKALYGTALGLGADALTLSSRISAQAFVDAKTSLLQPAAKIADSKKSRQTELWDKYPRGTVLAEEEFLKLKRQCLYVPMPSSVYGYAVHEMMLAGEDGLFNVLCKLLPSILRVVPVWVLQLIIPNYLPGGSHTIDDYALFRSDYLVLRLSVIAALLLHVALSFRDICIEGWTVLFCNNVIIDVCNNVIIDVNDNPRIQKNLKPLNRVLSVLAAAVFSIGIIYMEGFVWLAAMGRAGASIMSAKDLYEILGLALALFFVNEIDNIAYSVLIPESLRNLTAKQLFRLPGLPSTEIRPYRAELILIAIGISLALILFHQVFLGCHGLKPPYSADNILVVGMGNASLIANSSLINPSCSVPAISSIGNFSFFLWLNRTCAPPYGRWQQDNITAALITGTDANDEFTFAAATMPIEGLLSLPSLILFLSPLIIWLFI